MVFWNLFKLNQTDFKNILNGRHFAFRFFIFKRVVLLKISPKFKCTEFPSSGGVDQFSKKIETGWFFSPDKNGILFCGGRSEMETTAKKI